MELTKSIRSIMNIAIAIIIVAAVVTPILADITPETEITNPETNRYYVQGGTHEIEFDGSDITIGGIAGEKSSFPVVIADGFMFYKVNSTYLVYQGGVPEFGPTRAGSGKLTITDDKVTGVCYTAASHNEVEIEYEFEEAPYVRNPSDDGEFGLYERGTITVPNGVPVYVSHMYILGTLEVTDGSVSYNKTPYWSQSPYSQIESAEITQGYVSQNGMSIYDMDTIKMKIQFSDGTSRTLDPFFMAPISISTSDSDSPIYTIIGIVPIILVISLIGVTVAMFISQRQK